MHRLGLLFVLIFLSFNLALAQDKKKSTRPIKWSAQLQQTYKEITGLWSDGYFWDQVKKNIPPKFGFTAECLDEASWLEDEGRIYYIEYFDFEGLRARLDKNGEVTYYQSEGNGKWITRNIIRIDREDLLR